MLPQDINKRDWRFELSLVLFLMHSVPIIGWMTPTVVFLIITLLLYFTTFVFVGRRLFVYYLVRSWPISIIFILGFLLKLFLADSSLYTDIYGFLQILIVFIIGQHILTSNNVLIAKRLLLLFGFIYIGTAITTYVGCLSDPGVSRFLATTDASNDPLYGLYMSQNIGGFKFVYTLVLFIPLLIGCIKNKMKGTLIYIFTLLLFIVAIIETQYAAAVLLALVSLILFAAPRNFTKQKTRVFLILIGIVLLFGRVFLLSLLSFIAGKTDSQLISERFADISNIISGGEVNSGGTDVEARASLYQKSIDSFLNSPLIGNWDYSSIGGHSFFFDNIALYGLIGVIAYMLIWTTIYKIYLKENAGYEWRGYFDFAIIVSIVLSVLNPIVVFDFICLILPVFIVLLKYNSVRKKR